VLELDSAYGEPRAQEYAGGFAAYERRRAQVRERQEAGYEAYRDERARVDEQYRRMRGWEERGYGQGRKKKKTKDIGKAYEKKLARFERVEKPWEPWRLRLELAPSARPGDLVARLDGAVVRRGEFELGPLDLAVGWADRVAITGPNGAGKTTLLDALLGEVPLATGRRWVGPGAVFGRLRQDRGEFAGSGRLLAEFRERSRLHEEPARTLLAKFALGADDVLRAGRSLSPGERSRASLALLMAQGVNCLVLDEPTNHLDLPAIEELEAALDGFEGTVLLVTHDRRLLDRFDATQRVELGQEPL
jgi:ATPase subunit of ABC transporter with duplicated ATPase domains